MSGDYEFEYDKAHQWAWNVHTGDSFARFLLVAMTQRAGDGHTVRALGVPLPTRFGMYYERPGELSRRTFVSKSTIKRVIKALVACGVLLAEEDRRILRRFNLAKNDHNLQGVYYLNSNVDPSVTGKSKSEQYGDSWLPEAYCVAYRLVNKVSMKALTPNGLRMSDYPSDPVQAMRQLVPSHIWPAGFGPEDYKYAGTEGSTDAGDNSDVTDVADLDPGATQQGNLNMGGWDQAVADDEPDEQQPLPVAQIVSLSEKAAEKESAARAAREKNKAADVVLSQILADREEQELSVPIAKADRGRWWRVQRAAVRDFHSDGVPDEVIVAAFHETGVLNPKDWEVRSNFPEKYRAHLGRTAGDRFATIAQADAGAAGISAADYEASNQTLGEMLGDDFFTEH